MKGKPDFIVITDLDNTLLDKETYDFSPALPAIEELKKRNIPIIFCTSKTIGETIYFQHKLDINDPFIVENGGAAYIPRAFWLKWGKEGIDSEYYELVLGIRAEILNNFLQSFAIEHGVRLVSFLDLTTEEVALLTNLPMELAALAREREYDLPFVFEGSEDTFEELKREARDRGYLLQTGGRFHHISGHHTKADALKLLLREMGEEFVGVLKIGLGDSPNDLEMLAAVDVPIIVSADDNPYIDYLKQALPDAKIYSGRGPVGWNQAILEILEKI